MQERFGGGFAPTDIQVMEIDLLRSADSVWFVLADPSTTVEYVTEGWLGPVLLVLALVWLIARWRRSWLVVRIAQWLLAGFLLLGLVHHVQESLGRSAAEFEAANRHNATAVQNGYGVAFAPARLGCLQDLVVGSVRVCRVTTIRRTESVDYVFVRVKDIVTVSFDGRRLNPR